MGKRLGGKGAERVVGKRVDVDLAKDCVLLPGETLGIPRDRQVRFLYGDNAAQLIDLQP